MVLCQNSRKEINAHHPPIHLTIMHLNHGEYDFDVTQIFRTWHLSYTYNEKFKFVT